MFIINKEVATDLFKMACIITKDTGLLRFIYNTQ